MMRPNKSIDMGLPRAANPDDYPLWLLNAVKEALSTIIHDPEREGRSKREDAELMLRAIDRAILQNSANQPR